MNNLEDKKSAGKFAWFCLGSILALRGIPKIIHVIYITIIILLSCAAYTNIYQDYTVQNRVEAKIEQFKKKYTFKATTATIGPFKRLQWVTDDQWYHCRKYKNQKQFKQKNKK